MNTKIFKNINILLKRAIFLYIINFIFLSLYYFLIKLGRTVFINITSFNDNAYFIFIYYAKLWFFNIFS
jgi:hypothetical protein